MLRIINLEEIQRELNSISELVDLQQSRDFRFGEKVKLWLSNLEEIFKRNHLMQVGGLATLRGIILSAEMGIVPQGVEFHGTLAKRKIIEAAISFSLRQAGNIVTEVLQKEVDRIAEAERMMRQIIALAKVKGLLQQIPDGAEHTEMLKNLWQTLSNNPDIAPGTVNIEGLVGPHDSLIILDRLIAMDGPSH